MYRALLGGWCAARLVTWTAPGASANLWALAGIGLSLALAVGWFDRVAAAAVAVVHGVWLFAAAETSAGTDWITHGIAIALPLLHLSTPPAPYGSWAARGRLDPSADWRLPPVTSLAAWGLQAGVYLASAIYVIFKWGSVAPADAFERVMLGLLAGSWLAFVAGAAWPRSRKWVWTVSLGLDTLVLTWLGHGGAAMALAVLHGLTFCPAWLPPRPATEEPVIFYDGHCGLCHRWVRFVLAEDRDRLFALSPLQGELIQQKVPDPQRQQLPDSMVLHRGDGELLVRSSAVLHILDRLGGGWRVIGGCGRMVPRRFRDLLYTGVAAVRRKLYPEPEATCPMVPEHLRERFQD